MYMYAAPPEAVEAVMRVTYAPLQTVALAGNRGGPGSVHGRGKVGGQGGATRPGFGRSVCCVQTFTMLHSMSYHTL